jgi:tRNA threonylcarbamoyladenosine biosynthesis protein TsaE
MTWQIRRAGPTDASAMFAVIQAAFGARPSLDPPADALVESELSLAQRLTGDRGVVVMRDGEVVACCVLDTVEAPINDTTTGPMTGPMTGPLTGPMTGPVNSAVFLRRFSVRPDLQGRGLSKVLLRGAEQFAYEVAPTARSLRALARAELPDGIHHWLDQGFHVVARPTINVELARPMPERAIAATAHDMRALGHSLARRLRAGDLVLLIGELGAGKTTFAQGLGDGLGVRGSVTSPTFVISRIHPSVVNGPALVHVDAYRLGDGAELNDLDLDTSTSASVTVVEWGRGIAEELSDSRVEVEIVRALADDNSDDDARMVLYRQIGPRWAELTA